MKTTRDQLKALVKEILVEVLQEGIGQQRQARRAVPPTQVPRRSTFDPRLDVPLQGGRRPTDFLKEAVKRESGGNAVLADILADTALTTLPTQLSHGDSMGRPVASGAAPTQQEQFVGDVADVFGEGAEMRADGSSHWADLAFMAPKKAA